MIDENFGNQFELTGKSLGHATFNVRAENERHSNIVRIMIPVVVGSNPVSHPRISTCRGRRSRVRGFA